MPSAIRDFGFASRILSERLGTEVHLRDAPRAGVKGVLDPRDTYESVRDVRRKRLGKALCDEIAFRARVVAAARALDHAGVDFAQFDGEDAVNDKLWWLSLGGRMGVRKMLPRGRLGSPARALRDIFKNGSRYAFECATAMMVIYHKAILDTVGDAAFDRMFTDPGYLKIYRWSIKDDDYRDLEVMRSDNNALVPGNHYYYRNPGVDEANAAFAGENVIYLGEEDGERLFYAHGVIGDRGGFIVTKEELLDSLRELRSPGSKKEPYREMFSYSIDTRALAHKAARYAA